MSGRRYANAYSALKIINLDQIYEYFCLIRVFEHYILGTGNYFNKNFPRLKQSIIINTRFIVSQNLAHSNVRTSTVFKYFFFYISSAFLNKVNILAKKSPISKLLQKLFDKPYFLYQLIIFISWRFLWCHMFFSTIISSLCWCYLIIKHLFFAC